MRIKYIVRLTIAFLLFIFLYKLAGGKTEFINSFKKVNVFFIFIPLVLAVFSFFISSINLWLLLRLLHPMSYICFLKPYAYAFGISFFIPGQVGDASIALILKKQGVSITNIGFSYLLDKLVSITVVLSIAGLGILYIIPQMVKNINFFLLFSIPLLVLIVLFFSVKILIKLNFNRINKFISELQQIKNIYKKKYTIVIVNMLLSLLNLLVVSLSYFFAFLSFDNFVPWPDAGIIPIISSLVGYIPVTFSGIGTVEYSSVYLFSFLGVSSTIVICVYLLQRIIQYFVAFIMYLIFGILFNKS